VVLESGEEAKPGELFHNTKNKAYKEMEVLVAFAKKGTAKKKDFNTGDETDVPAYRAVMLPLMNPYSPFVMTFKQMALWNGWKPYLSKLSADGITNMDHVVKMTTRKIDTNYNSVVYVPNLEIAVETTDEQRALIKDVFERFGGVLDNTEEIEDSVNEATEEISDLDLDG